MSGVSTIDMVVVGTFLLISIFVLGCMFLLNCFYYKQRHGHESTILAHTLGSRKPCAYNRSTSIVITAPTTTSPYPVLNAGDQTKLKQQVYPVAQTSTSATSQQQQQQERANFL